MQRSLDLQRADRFAITGGRDRRGAGSVAVFRRFFQRDGADRRTGCEGDGICDEAAVGISADLDGIGVCFAAVLQFCAIGLRSDGTLVATEILNGDFLSDHGQNEVSGWSNIKLPN